MKDEKEIIIVSGLPRSGTSMMMSILKAGGIELLMDDKRQPDNNNPNGYFEFEATKRLMTDNTWLDQAQGKAVKIVAPLLKYLPDSYNYRVIFMNRNMDEIIASQQIMLNKPTAEGQESLARAFEKELIYVEKVLSLKPYIKFFIVNYESVINDSENALKDILSFMQTPLDIIAMKKVIDIKLYRNRAK